MVNQSETVAVSKEHGSSHSEKDFLSPDMNMVLLTWVTFFLLMSVLYKYAWKPILTVLDSREESIRKSLEDVDHIKAEMENLEAKCSERIAEVERKAKEIIDQSRKAAKEAASIIESKAREEAQISLENAVREIKEQTEKAQTQLRKESAQIAVGLASKLIEENISIERNQSIIKKYVKEI